MRFTIRLLCFASLFKSCHSPTTRYRSRELRLDSILRSLPAPDLERSKDESAMKYYLETNSLINASSYLGRPEVSDCCFVSIHGIIELVTDLSVSVFGSKQAAIRRIMQSHVEIDWRLPQQILFEAFGIEAIYEISESNVREIMNAMVNATDLKRFTLSIEERGLSHIYETIKGCDSQYNNYFPNELLDNTEALERSNQLGVARNYVSVFESRNDQSSNSYNPEFRQQMIQVIKDQVARDLAASKYNCQQITAQQISSKYDNTLDPFLLAIFLYSHKKSSLKEKPKRNDFTDLHHLAYLGNENIIVTDDKMLLKALQMYYPHLICTCTSYRERFPPASTF